MTLRELCKNGVFHDCGSAVIHVEGRDRKGKTQFWNDFGIKDSPNGCYSMRGTFGVQDMSMIENLSESMSMILDLEIDTIYVDKRFRLDSTGWELPKRYITEIHIYADLSKHAKEFAYAVKRRGM